MRLLGILTSLSCIIWVTDCRGIGGLEIGDDVGDISDDDFCYGKLAGGFYADVESECTKFHACMLDAEGKSMDIVFSCVNGTLFDQRSRSCKAEDEVIDICNKSQDYFGRNVDLYSVKENHLQDRKRRDVFDIEDDFEGEEEDEPEMKQDEKSEMKEEDKPEIQLDIKAETTTAKEEMKSNSIKIPKIPQTKFRCSTRKMGDYYADPEADCQLFHVCAVGLEGEILDFRFLCLNNTRFNPKTRACEDSRKVPCINSPRSSTKLPAMKDEKSQMVREDELEIKSENRVDPDDTALEDEEEEEIKPKKLSEDRRSKPKEVEVEEGVVEDDDEVKPKKNPSEERRSKPKGTSADERPKSRGRQKRPPEQRIKKETVEVVQAERKKREIIVSPVFDVVREGVRLKRQAFDPPRYDRNFLPRTSFTCKDKVAGGYYADPETDCQMYHVCAPGTLGSLTDFKFLCSNDTVFNQQTRTCVDYELVDCANAVAFYSINDDLIKSPEIEEDDFDIPKSRPQKQQSPGRKKEKKTQRRPNIPVNEEAFQQPQSRRPVVANDQVPIQFQDSDFSPPPRSPSRSSQSLPAFATDDGFSAAPVRAPSRSSQRPASRPPQRINPLQEEFESPSSPPRNPSRSSQKPSRQRVIPIEGDFQSGVSGRLSPVSSDRPLPRHPTEEQIPQVVVRGPSRSSDRSPPRQPQGPIPIQEELPPQIPLRPPSRQNSAPRQRPIPIEEEFQPHLPVRAPPRQASRQSQRPIPVEDDFQPVQVSAPSRSSSRNAARTPQRIIPLQEEVPPNAPRTPQRIIPLQEEVPPNAPIPVIPRSSKRPVPTNFDAIPVDESQFAALSGQGEVRGIPQQERRKPTSTRSKAALPQELSDFFDNGPPVPPPQRRAPRPRSQQRPPSQFDDQFLPSSQVFHVPQESEFVEVYVPPPRRFRRTTDHFAFKGFTCQDKIPGLYYADISTGCSMFHVCALGRKEVYDFKFLCTNDTRFDQYEQNCLPKEQVSCRHISNSISKDINRGRREIESMIEARKKSETVPKTSFSCHGKTNGDYYADPETDCRTFHLCMRDIDGNSVDFVFQCLDSTVFNMKTKTCDLSEKVQCKYDSLSSNNETNQES